MEFVLLALGAPSNIEKKVRDLQTRLYRQGGLASARALPVIIPLCFLDPRLIPSKPEELRKRLHGALGKEAPYLSSGTVAECDGFLYWDLSPRRELQRLRRNCETVFTDSEAGQIDRQPARQPDLFPIARGFFLCSLQGRQKNTLPSLHVSEHVRFPAKAGFLLHLQSLRTEPGATTSSVSSDEEWSPWTALFWEKRGEIPLRKTRAEN
jgi:hypothetical protein